MMNRQELLKACLEKIELYRDAVKSEYLGGMPLQRLLPELREAISSVPEENTQDAKDAARYRFARDHGLIYADVCFRHEHAECTSGRVGTGHADSFLNWRMRMNVGGASDA